MVVSQQLTRTYSSPAARQVETSLQAALSLKLETSRWDLSRFSTYSSMLRWLSSCMKVWTSKIFSSPSDLPGKLVNDST